MLQKQQKEFLVFMVKVSLLTAKSKTGFQSFVLTICNWEINPDQDALQVLVERNLCKSARGLTIDFNRQSADTWNRKNEQAGH